MSFLLILIACSVTYQFGKWLYEKYKLHRLKKIDPAFAEIFISHQKLIDDLKTNPAVTENYLKYRLNLKSGESPLPLEKFIVQILLELKPQRRRFELQLDERGEILSVKLEGYGEISLELIKICDRNCYEEIIQGYKNFKRENNL